MNSSARLRREQESQRTRPARLLRLRSTSLNQSCPASAASSMACCTAEPQEVVPLAKKCKKASAESSEKSPRKISRLNRTGYSKRDGPAPHLSSWGSGSFVRKKLSQ